MKHSFQSMHVGNISHPVDDTFFSTPPATPPPPPKKKKKYSWRLQQISLVIGLYQLLKDLSQSNHVSYFHQIIIYGILINSHLINCQS